MAEQATTSIKFNTAIGATKMINLVAGYTAMVEQMPYRLGALVTVYDADLRIAAVFSDGFGFTKVSRGYYFEQDPYGTASLVHDVTEVAKIVRI